MPMQASNLLLNRWREAERRAAEAPAGTPEAAELRAKADRLRDAYNGYLIVVMYDPPRPFDKPPDKDPLSTLDSD
jgi:hypothetical protein